MKPIHQQSSPIKYAPEAIVILLSLLAIFYRLRYFILKDPPLRVDEAFQLVNIERSIDFWAMVKGLPSMDHGGYLAGDYILLYPFVKLFGHNLWALMMPHLIIAMMGFYFMYLIGKEYFQTLWAYVVACSILCFNANLIFHSTELRPYAVLSTLSLVIFYGMHLLVERYWQLSNIQKWLIGIMFVTVLWFHVYGIFILFCVAIYFLLIKLKDLLRERILWPIIKFLIIVGIIASPLWLYSMLGVEISKHAPENIWQFIPSPINNPIGFLKAIFGNLIGERRLYFLLAGVLFPWFIPYKNRGRQIVFFLTLIVLPILLILAVVLKNQYWFLQRHFVWVMPLFALFLAQAWDSAIVYIKAKAAR